MTNCIVCNKPVFKLDQVFETFHCMNYDILVINGIECYHKFFYVNKTWFIQIFNVQIKYWHEFMLIDGMWTKTNIQPITAVGDINSSIQELIQISQALDLFK
jgi:hypothetical protein